MSIEIGDKVKLNSKYYKEGLVYFGKSLKFRKNFIKKVVSVSEPSTCSNGEYLPPVITLEGKKDGYPIQFAQCLLELA